MSGSVSTDKLERLAQLKHEGFADVEHWQHFRSESQKALLGVIRNDPQTTQLKYV
jgi:hypothetical protein